MKFKKTGEIADVGIRGDRGLGNRGLCMMLSTGHHGGSRLSDWVVFSSNIQPFLYAMDQF